MMLEFMNVPTKVRGSCKGPDIPWCRTTNTIQMETGDEDLGPTNALQFSLKRVSSGQQPRFNDNVFLTVNR